MRYFLFLFCLLVPSVLHAEERERLLGTWGTEKQCSRSLILDRGTVRAEPFEISANWLKHGDLWCKLTWFPVEKRANGFFTGAFAACGEDAVRNYLLGMVMADDTLTLRWDFPIKNGPLDRCEPNSTN